MSFAYSCKEEIINKERTKRELKALSFGMVLASLFEGKCLIKLSNKNVYQFFKETIQDLKKEYKWEFVEKEYPRYMQVEVLNFHLEIADVKYFLLNQNNLITNFLAGCFLVRGSVNDPNSSKYHFELAILDPKVAVFTLSLINEFEFNAKVSKRRGKLVIYIKDAEKIVDIIRLIGAENNAFSYEDIRIQKDFQNSINRLMNCEIANEQKSLTASREQLRYIKYLEYNYPLEQIDKKTLLVMKVRKDNPEASLNELIAIIEENYGIKFSKPNLAHKFKKIKDLANLDYQNRKN